MNRILSVLLFVLATITTACAQNAGNVGTFTMAQVVFNADSNASDTSATLRNIGQSSHFLTICINPIGAGPNFIIVTLQESFDGTTNWVPIAATQVLTGTCSVLQAGGYYQNVRVTYSGLPIPQTISAWYSASTGPIGFLPPGVGTAGPTSPAVCDQSTALNVINNHIDTFITAQTGKKIYVCGVVATLDAVAGAGMIEFFENPTACASGENPLFWKYDTTANTPQFLPFGSGQGSLFHTDTGLALCVEQTTGTTVEVTISYAVI